MSNRTTLFESDAHDKQLRRLGGAGSGERGDENEERNCRCAHEKYLGVRQQEAKRAAVQLAARRMGGGRKSRSAISSG